MRPLLRLPFRLALELVRGQSSPRQLAVAICFGMLIGLLPKLNLIVVGTTVLAICIPVNLLVVVLSTVVFSFAGVMIGAVGIQLGHWLLGLDSVQHWLRSFYELPLAAWTSLEDPALIGNLAIALALVLPGYFTSRILIAKNTDAIQRYLYDFWLYRAFVRPDTTVSGAIE